MVNRGKDRSFVGWSVILSLLLYCGCANQPSAADTAQPVSTFTGRVIEVKDGDSLVVLNGTQQIEVRLASIDCPEFNQSFGRQARQRTADLCLGKSVLVQGLGKDRYGRTLAVVSINEQKLNHQLVVDGFAWHYKKYSDDKALTRLENEARKSRRGLWANDRAMAPWDWRKQSRSKTLGQAAADTSPSTRRASSSQALRPLSKNDSTVAQNNQLTYWLNTSTGVRHNRSCRWFGKTKRGRKCEAKEGRACGQCGG